MIVKVLVIRSVRQCKSKCKAMQEGLLLEHTCTQAYTHTAYLLLSRSCRCTEASNRSIFPTCELSIDLSVLEGGGTAALTYCTLYAFATAL